MNMKMLWLTTAMVSSTVAGISCGTAILFVWLVVRGAIPPSTVAVAVVAATSSTLLAATAAVAAVSAGCNYWRVARA